MFCILFQVCFFYISPTVVSHIVTNRQTRDNRISLNMSSSPRQSITNIRRVMYIIPIVSYIWYNINITSIYKQNLYHECQIFSLILDQKYFFVSFRKGSVIKVRCLFLASEGRQDFSEVIYSQTLRQNCC